MSRKRAEPQPEVGMPDAGELPEGWELVKFFDYVDFQEGPGIMAKDFTESGVPLLRITNIRKRNVDLNGCNFLAPEKVERKWNHFRLKKQDILISSSASIGSVSEVTDDSAGSIAYTGIIRLRPKVEQLDRQFLKIFVCSTKYFQQIESLMTGITIRHYGPSHLKQVKIPLPSLPEQQRIVARVEALLTQVNAAREQLNRVPLIMKRFRQTVLELAIQGRLTSNGTNERIRVDETLPFCIPEDWKYEPIEKNVERLTNGYVGPTRDIYVDSGIPYLLARHIKNHKIIFDDRTFITDEFNQKNKKSILKKGDVLIVQSGDIGQTAVVDDNHVGHNCHALIVITPQEIVLNGYYLSIYFSSITGQETTRHIQTGITLKHLNCKDVKKIKIPLPPLAEQHEIVRRVDAIFARVDAVEREVAAASKRAEALTQAVLAKAFRGELVTPGRVEGKA